MIASLRIQNFKSLHDVDLRLGPLNVFIGTNASGKSNVLDAIRVLQGIGNGFTVGEILDGKPKSSTSEVWDSIRGGSAKAVFTKANASSFRIEVGIQDASQDPGSTWAAEYGIGIHCEQQRVIEEWLTAGKPIYDSRPIANSAAGAQSSPTLDVRYFTGKKGMPPHVPLEPHRTVLAQMLRARGDRWTKAHVGVAERISRLFSNTQRLDPAPSILREYSQAQNVTRMGERGENFAALVRTICEDPATKQAYLSWLRQLRPSEVDDVGVIKGAIGDIMFQLVEGGEAYPAPVLSDGTLRFAAITAAFFQPDMPSLLTLEEIENGIHATRLRLLVELLRNRAQSKHAQVIVTTHSPIVLSWLTPKEHEHTFFCRRDERTGESIIKPLTQIPRFNEIVRKQPIADLFAEGWMEAAL